MDSNKKLKIQIGIIKRMIKEVKHYQDELKTNKQKLLTMELNGCDKYDKNKQIELIEESNIMIVDSKKRLKKSKETFEEVLNEVSEDSNLDISLIEETESLFTEIC